MQGNVPASRTLCAIWGRGWEGGATSLPVVTARTTLGEGVRGNKNNTGRQGQLGRQRHLQRGAPGEEGGPRRRGLSGLIHLPAPQHLTWSLQTAAAENTF